MSRDPIVILIVEDCEHAFYASTARRGFVCISDPNHFVSEEETGGTVEEIIACARVTEH
jgi:hypothetical protein